MRLNKRDLAAKLGISERSLTIWQHEGLPVLERGRRGQQNFYDLAAVVRWIGASRHGRGANSGEGRIDLDKLERELGLGPVDADVCTAPTSRDLARAIMLARVDWFKELPSWGFSPPPAEMADLGGLLIGAITRRLAVSGFASAAETLNAALGDDAYPNDFEAILQRFRAEVPTMSNGDLSEASKVAG